MHVHDKRIRRALVVMTAAATIVAPATVANAGTAPAENCFIHTDDWVACVCQPVARVLSDVTGRPWMCA
jgi:hypothetical protein